MTEGHPCFVANNGRLGFGLDDYARTRPRRAGRCGWCGSRPAGRTPGSPLGAGLDERGSCYDGELGADMPRPLRRRLRGARARPGRLPATCPVHPWQWENKLAVTFAADVARRDLVCLGQGPTTTRPSSRSGRSSTLDRPERHYVKTALSVLNMGFMRGLSPAYMAATPAINDWVADLVAADETLQECGFAVLRELAAVGYTGDAYHAAADPSRPTEDAGRAVAGEPGAAARPRASGWRRWPRCCTATATGARWSPR